MNAPRLAVVGILLFGLAFAVQAGDKDKKKDDSIKTKLVGTWEAESGKGLPKGAKVQFTKDGKVIINAKRDAKEMRIEGTYKVEGNTLKVTTKREDKERTQELKVTKVDDKQLVLEDPKGDAVTFKKASKTDKKES
jgi:uncharacterized protein (TIGR03066 family)